MQTQVIPNNLRSNGHAPHIEVSYHTATAAAGVVVCWLLVSGYISGQVQCVWTGVGRARARPRPRTPPAHPDTADNLFTVRTCSHAPGAHCAVMSAATKQTYLVITGSLHVPRATS